MAKAPQYALKRDLEAFKKEVKKLIREATKKPVVKKASKVVKRRKKAA